MDYEQLCNKILNIDPKIRFAGVYHQSTEKVSGGFKKGVLPLLPTDQGFQRTILRAMVARTSHKMLEEYCGKEKYAFLEFEKIKGCMFPLEEELVLIVSMDPDGNSDILLKHVPAIIQEQIQAI